MALLLTVFPVFPLFHYLVAGKPPDRGKETCIMKRNGLIRKRRVLGVCGRPDILRMLEDKIKEGFPRWRFDGVTTAENAGRLMLLSSYHLLIVDEANFKKIQHAGSSVIQNFPILVLTDKEKLPADQQNSFTPNVCGYLLASRLEEIIPIFSRLLSIEFTPRWQRPFRRYGGIFNLATVEVAEKLFKNDAMMA